MKGIDKQKVNPLCEQYDQIYCETVEYNNKMNEYN